MVNLDPQTDGVGSGESASDQFKEVIQDAKVARTAKNRADLSMALEHARAIAPQLESDHQKDAWSTIEILERDLDSLN